MSAQRVMAVPRPRGAQLRKGVVDFRHGDRALRDVHQLMNIAAIKTDDIILGMNRNAVAITVRQRRGNDGPHGRLSETRDAVHRLFDLPGLEFQLMRVADVLIAATAATPKIRARRFDPLGRCFQHFEQLCFGELFFLADDLRRDALAIDRERNEDSLARIARDAFPPKATSWMVRSTVRTAADSTVGGAFVPRHC